MSLVQIFICIRAIIYFAQYEIYILTCEHTVMNLMSQATALVHVYLDGSVLLSHGGVEMGQGLHTKTVQIASRVLGVPVEMIHKVENSTAQIANSSTTAASGSTDLNGVAVQVCVNLYSVET